LPKKSPNKLCSKIISIKICQFLRENILIIFNQSKLVKHGEQTNIHKANKPSESSLAIIN